MQCSPADSSSRLDNFLKLLLRVLKILVWIFDFKTLFLELFILQLLFLVYLLFHILVTFCDLLDYLRHLTAFQLLNELLDAV